MRFGIRVLLLFVLFSGISCVRQLTAVEQTPSASTNEPRLTPPPGEETPEIKTLIDKAQNALASGTLTTTDVLVDPTYMPVHEWTRFRNVIRTYATAKQLVIVTPNEPGDPLIVSGTISNQQFEPIKDALVYVYHTSAKGWYSDKAPHVSGQSGDERHARLFGYLTTDAAGRYEFRTIRPAGYPNSNLPAHIHIEIEAKGNERRTLISEIRFEDDPRLSDELREASRRERFLVVPVKRGAGVNRVEANFQLN